MSGAVIILGIIAIGILLLVGKGVRVVQQYEKGLVERFGQYTRTVDPGLRLIIPFLDHMSKVDMREQVVEVPPQEVITKDNVVVTVDAVTYYEPTDPVKLKYNVANFMLASTKLAQTNLRNLVGELQLDEALTSRELINTRLREILDDATNKWGVRIVRVEIQRVEPPTDVMNAMHRQMKAERERRAVILEAEGQKQSAILKAEGIKQAQIVEAQGQGDAIKTVADANRYEREQLAEGEGRAIERVFGAIHTGDPTPDLLAIRYMEALGKVADGKATKIFMPLEASGLMSSVGAITELFGMDPASTATGNGGGRRKPALAGASGGSAPTPPPVPPAQN